MKAAPAGGADAPHREVFLQHQVTQNSVDVWLFSWLPGELFTSTQKEVWPYHRAQTGGIRAEGPPRRALYGSEGFLKKKWQFFLGVLILLLILKWRCTDMEKPTAQCWWKETNITVLIFIFVCWDMWNIPSLLGEEKECVECEKRSSSDGRGPGGPLRSGGQKTHLTITGLTSSMLECSAHTGNRSPLNHFNYSHSFKKYLMYFHDPLGLFFERLKIQCWMFFAFLKFLYWHSRLYLFTSLINTTEEKRKMHGGE